MQKLEGLNVIPQDLVKKSKSREDEDDDRKPTASPAGGIQKDSRLVHVGIHEGNIGYLVGSGLFLSQTCRNSGESVSAIVTAAVRNS